MKQIFKYIIVTIIMVILFIFLLYITGKIPKSLVEQNIEKSVKPINYVVDRPLWREAFTDAIMLDLVYRHDSDDSLRSSLRNVTISNYPYGLDPYYGYNGQEALESNFFTILDDNNENIKYSYEYEYGRYWHGYLIFLRPLLVFFNYNQISMICTIISWFLCIYLLNIVKSKLGLKYMFITLFCLISIEYFTITISISLFPTLAIMMISSILILKMKEKIKDIRLFFFIIGGVTTYFCWFNFTLLTLGFPLIFYYLLENDNKKFSLKLFFQIVILYFLWRGTILLSKWIIADLICNTSIIKDALNQVLYRLSSTDYKHEKASFIDAIFLNCKYYLSSIEVLIIYLVCRFLFCKIYKEKTNEKISRNVKIIYTLIALIPFFLYIGAVNYAHVHSGTYTHRLLMISLFSIIAMFENKLEKGYKDIDINIDKKVDKKLDK